MVSDTDNQSVISDIVSSKSSMIEKDVLKTPLPYETQELIEKIKKHETKSVNIEKLYEKMNLMCYLQKPNAAEKQEIKDTQSQLKKELGSRNKILNQNRLRQTVIKGIPCEFTKFIDIIIPPNPEAAQSEEQKAFSTIGPPADKDYFNLRHKIWSISTKMDETQQRLIIEYRQKRCELIKEIQVI